MDKFDVIEKFSDGTVIHHGKSNDRAYLIKKGKIEVDKLICQLKDLAKKNSYSKIFAKSNLESLSYFIDQDFTVEAIIPQYYDGQSDLFWTCCYLNDNRPDEHKALQQNYKEVLALAKSKQLEGDEVSLPDNNEVIIRKCTPNDTAEMVAIYKKIFASYPFPIYDENYLIKTMHDSIDYYCAEKNGKIIALGTAELDFDSLSAEMTDFATLPESRGLNIALQILAEMEKKSAQKGIKTFFTIARAISPAMNITFAKHGYKYGGRLKNNTNISGSIESMNVWYSASS